MHADPAMLAARNVVLRSCGVAVLYSQKPPQVDVSWLLLLREHCGVQEARLQMRGVMFLALKTSGELVLHLGEVHRRQRARLCQFAVVLRTCLAAKVLGLCKISLFDPGALRVNAKQTRLARHLSHRHLNGRRQSMLNCALRAHAFVL